MIASAVHLSELPAPGADLSPFLGATPCLDIAHPELIRFVAKAVAGRSSDRERAVALFYAVRDNIRYDPYTISFDKADYQASAVIEAAAGWCVPKAGLLAACARSVGIPAAIGLADVVNHLNSEKLRAMMGTDVFYDHGYAALYLDGHWVKAVPAFNIELCERFGVRPTEFDGSGDALYQEHDAQGRRHMQYLSDHGIWSDMPLAKLIADFDQHYPAIAAAARARATAAPNLRTAGADSRDDPF